MNLPQPLGNNVLVEIIDPHAAVSYASESQKKGKLVAFNIESYHLTASSAILLGDAFTGNLKVKFANIIRSNAFVYWEEFANEGQGFTHNGKNYAFVAWWRLTGMELPDAKDK